MKIVFENEFFVAVDKEAGSLTTPARFGDKDPRPVLGLELQKSLGRQIYPVHRLDFEVSGIVLYALSASAHSQANSQFEGKSVLKTYQALSENKNPVTPEPGAQLEWKSRILRGKKRAFESPHGKPSLTLARFVGEGPAGLCWELKPVTGRSHQLRFDLSRHGYPIVGDVLYGAQAGLSKDRIELRSMLIEFQDAEFLRRWKLPVRLEVPGLF
jgi:23S rRNA-/tRNA-specific pseudouridylate synthase